MCWIGIKKFNIKDLHVFMDNFFSWSLKYDLLIHKGIPSPRSQACLLIFWDKISCCWKAKRHEFGMELKIIGFYVDINRSTSMDESIISIISIVHSFLVTPGHRPPLREWLHIRGHLNWVFNVIPLGQPALSELYRKMAGKNLMHASIALNADVIRNLEWLINIIPKGIGVHFLNATHWNNQEANFVLWTDASLCLGLCFTYAGRGFTYVLSTNVSKGKIDIFFFELMVIPSVVHHIALFPHSP
jgi:hypothetical protein